MDIHKNARPTPEPAVRRIGALRRERRTGQQIAYQQTQPSPEQPVEAPHLARPLRQVDRAQSKEGQDHAAFARHVTWYTGPVAIKGVAETGGQHPAFLDDVERGAEQEVERQKRERGECPGGHGEAAVREKVVEEHGVSYPSVAAINQQS